jgi:hypothetical protein
MKPIYTVNREVAPLNSLSKFRKWHALACPDDPLTAKERYDELRGNTPEPTDNEIENAVKELNDQNDVS